MGGSTVCPNQPINYTFIIGTDENDPQHSGLLWEGPYFHTGPGIIYHCVNGLKQDKDYSIVVQVNSISGNSDSYTYCQVTEWEYSNN